MSMRAGPLSDPGIIHLLNSFFVPVYATVEDYRPGGAKWEGEGPLYREIRAEAKEEGRHDGTVCVYLIAPDGDGFDSLIVSQANKTPRLRQFLESAITRLSVSPGKALLPTVPQNVTPEVPFGGVVLYVVSRGNPDGDWSGLPGESWIPLESDEWWALVPDPQAEPGERWEVDEAIAEKILTHVHPPTRISRFESQRLPSGPHGHQVEAAELEGKVLAREGNILRVRFDGRSQIKRAARPFKPDENRAVATIVGFAELDVETQQLRSLQLVSGDGHYAGFEFRVAIKLAESK